MQRDLAGQDDTETDVPDVITRPPFLFLGALLLGLVLDRVAGLPFRIPGGDLAHAITGASLVLGGLAIGITGIRNFTRAGTPVRSVHPTQALVTTGIHGRTRNPIYIGMFLVYLGLAVAAHSPWALLLTVPLALLIRWGVVAREEAYLERRFGGAYLEYKSRVRRWL